jgi:hypothetical protein
MVQEEDRDLKIDIDYESGELFMDYPGFSKGLFRDHRSIRRMGDP